MNESKIKVVLLEPGKPARIECIGSDLESMQKIVGGLIEPIWPFEDPVALVCNEEGKLLHLDMNRALCDEQGNIWDIIFGTAFLCGESESSFASLTDELAEKYLKKFRNPERFMFGPTGIIVVKEENNE